VWFCKCLFFPKANENENKNRKNIFYFGGPDKGLTLLLRIFIRVGKSGLRSFLLKRV